MPHSVKVQIVADVICSHSYLGYTRFARAANRLRAEGVAVEVEFLPFELAPGASSEGQPLLAVLEQTFGSQAVGGALAFAERAAREGLRFEYGKAIATGTFDAHVLIADAALQDKAEPMAERLFRAHFTDGLHIGDPATLARLAAEVGVATGGVLPPKCAPASTGCAASASPACRSSSSRTCPRSPDPRPRPRCWRPCDRPPGKEHTSDRPSATAGRDRRQRPRRPPRPCGGRLVRRPGHGAPGH
jgi:2-hydroxychromene-2-carboxylate isomerase